MATKRGLAAFVLSVACVGVAACDVQDDDIWDGQSLRAAGDDVDFWNFHANDPGNGDVNLSEDDDDDGLPPTIVWDLGNNGGGTDVFDPAGTLVAFTAENQIFDADGNVRCTAHLEADLYKLRQGLDGEVLLTATAGRYVFWGDVQALPEPGTAAWQQLIYTQLGYEFYGELLYDGPRWIADVIAQADAPIHKASPMRKLLVASLYEGVCGTASQPQG